MQGKQHSTTEPTPGLKSWVFFFFFNLTVQLTVFSMKPFPDNFSPIDISVCVCACTHACVFIKFVDTAFCFKNRIFTPFLSHCVPEALIFPQRLLFLYLTVSEVVGN